MLNERGLPITAEDLAAARAEVGDRCFLCRKPARRGDPLVPDHSQQTSYFRAWVHQSENLAEGQLRKSGVLTDNPASFDKLQFWVIRLMALVLAGVRPNTSARAANMTPRPARRATRRSS